MVEKLTKERLLKYGFALETIKRVMNWKDYPSMLKNDNGDFYACNIDKKIYSGIDALRKEHFRNENQLACPETCFPLMLEFYDITFRIYLKKYSEIKAKSHSNTDTVKAEQYFLENQIKIVADKISGYEGELNKYIELKQTTIINHLDNKITEIERYSDWLENKKNELGKPKQKSETPQLMPEKNVNITPENPYPEIFTSTRGFQIFEAFKNEIITEATDYADYSFLFTKLKADGLIHDMRHKRFIDFLGEKYSAKFAANYKQFKFSETAHKKSTYSRYKKQFQ